MGTPPSDRIQSTDLTGNQDEAPSRIRLPHRRLDRLHGLLPPGLDPRQGAPVALLWTGKAHWNGTCGRVPLPRARVPHARAQEAWRLPWQLLPARQLPLLRLLPAHCLWIDKEE